MVYKQLTNAVDDRNRNTIRTVESRYRFARSSYWVLTDPASGRYKRTERRNKQGLSHGRVADKMLGTESNSDDGYPGPSSLSTRDHTRRQAGRRHSLCCPQGGLRRPQREPESKKEITTREHNGTHRRRKPLTLLERGETLISQDRTEQTHAVGSTVTCHATK